MGRHGDGESGLGNRLKIGMGMAALLCLLLIAGIGGYAWYMGLSWDRGRNVVDDPTLGQALTQPSPNPTSGDRTEKTAPMNILLLGSDSRQTDVDYASARGFRSDTIMVVHIPADRTGLQLLSIPRDSWVDISGHGKAKINAAASFGGLPLAVSTLSKFIGAPIQHVAIIDFAGFEDLTNALGGVEVNSRYAFTNGDSHFVEGLNLLDGRSALDFVRERKQFPDGDLQRIRNQQEFLRALGFELIEDDSLRNPVELAKLIKQLSPYLTVDPGLDARRLLEIGAQLRTVSNADVDFFTAPIAGAGTSSDGQEYLRVNTAQLKKLRQAFARDTVADYAAEAKEQHL